MFSLCFCLKLVWSPIVTIYGTTKRHHSRIDIIISELDISLWLMSLWRWFKPSEYLKFHVKLSAKLTVYDIREKQIFFIHPFCSKSFLTVYSIPFDRIIASTLLFAVLSSTLKSLINDYVITLMKIVSIGHQWFYRFSPLWPRHFHSVDLIRNRSSVNSIILFSHSC